MAPLDPEQWLSTAEQSLMHFQSEELSLTSALELDGELCVLLSQGLSESHLIGCQSGGFGIRREYKTSGYLIRAENHLYFGFHSLN